MEQQSAQKSTSSQVNPNAVPSSSDGTAAKAPATKPLVRSVEDNGSAPMKKKNSLIPTLVLSLVIVIAGIGTGYALHQFAPAGSASPSTPAQPALGEDTEVKVAAVYGSKDKDAFKDSAEGVLVKGGIEGEGSHHLLREGGKTRNVYLTSSVMDLDLFEGHKVEVWGETFAAQKAGWLMDVGRLEVKELNAEKPFEE